MEKKDEANGVVVRSSEKISREKEEGKGKENNHHPLPLMALNHVSRLQNCERVHKFLHQSYGVCFDIELENPLFSPVL
jgi:hypothetical protein